MERHIILALSLVAIIVPSMVLAAPTLLDQLMDINTPGEQNVEAVQSLEKRDVGFEDDFGTLTQQIRERRATKAHQCVMHCWLCMQALRKDSIQLGNCISGCSGLPSRKMLTNPLDAQSWSRCRNNFVQ